VGKPSLNAAQPYAKAEGRLFLLVLAYPGCPGTKAVVVFVVVVNGIYAHKVFVNNDKRLHGMYKIHAIAINVPVFQSLSFDTQEMAEWIEVLFWVRTLGGPRNIVLDGDLDFPIARGRGSAFDAAFAKLLWPLVSRNYVNCMSLFYRLWFKLIELNCKYSCRQELTGTTLN